MIRDTMCSTGRCWTRGPSTTPPTPGAIPSGAAVEWRQGDWSLPIRRRSISPDVPNSETLDPNFGQFQLDRGGGAAVFAVAGHAGSLKVTGFLTRGRMGRLRRRHSTRQSDGLRAADTALVRRYRSRTGVSLNLQQQLSETVAMFARAGLAGGGAEPYEFADIDRTVSERRVVERRAVGPPRRHRRYSPAWSMPFRTSISRYLAAGGLGILIGDGRLPHYGTEDILETLLRRRADQDCPRRPRFPACEQPGLQPRSRSGGDRRPARSRTILGTRGGRRAVCSPPA